MKKLLAEVENLDGTTTTVRVLAADRMRASEIAQRNGITLADEPVSHGLMVWSALRRAGLTHTESLTAWREGEVADFALTVQDEEAGDATDPTSTTTGL